MSHDVFISYGGRDKSIADAVCHALEKEGIRCWIAPRDALPGNKYQGSIVRAIRSSRAMVLIFSSSANQSEPVFRELHVASEHRKPVVPFRIEEVEPTDDLYYYISALHWLDALTSPLEPHIKRLVQIMKPLVGEARVDGAGEEPRNPRAKRGAAGPRLAAEREEPGGVAPRHPYSATPSLYVGLLLVAVGLAGYVLGFLGEVALVLMLAGLVPVGCWFLGLATGRRRTL